MIKKSKDKQSLASSMDENEDLRVQVRALKEQLRNAYACQEEANAGQSGNDGGGGGSNGGGVLGAAARQRTGMRVRAHSPSQIWVQYATI